MGKEKRPNSSELKKAKKIEDLLELAKRGYTASEVPRGLGIIQTEREVAARNRRNQEMIDAGVSPSEYRGLMSEDHVADILSQLPYIVNVTQTDPFSKADQQGKDIVVHVLNHPDYSDLNNHHLFVQVKSSDFHIKKFKQNIIDYYLITSDKIDLFLARKRLIILNATLPVENLIEEFENQLDLINQHNKF